MLLLGSKASAAPLLQSKHPHNCCSDLLWLRLQIFLTAIQLFLQHRSQDVGAAVFDKDDDLAVEFVTAAANLRSIAYNIPTQSLFAAKVNLRSKAPLVADLTATALPCLLCSALPFPTASVLPSPHTTFCPGCLLCLASSCLLGGYNKAVSLGSARTLPFPTLPCPTLPHRSCLICSIIP